MSVRFQYLLLPGRAPRTGLRGGTGAVGGRRRGIGGMVCRRRRRPWGRRRPVAPTPPHPGACIHPLPQHPSIPLATSVVLPHLPIPARAKGNRSAWVVFGRTASVARANRLRARGPGTGRRTATRRTGATRRSSRTSTGPTGRRPPTAAAAPGTTSSTPGARFRRRRPGAKIMPGFWGLLLLVFSIRKLEERQSRALLPRPLPCAGTEGGTGVLACARGGGCTGIP